MREITLSAILISFFLVQVGCSDKDADLMAYRGTTYPPTSKIDYIFQATQAPQSCRVFAELLATLPTDADGKLIQQKLENEAKARGADMVLVGQSRQMEDDEGFTFVYYGPQKEYFCNEQWCGWKYGYDAWEEQGDFVNIGFQEWGNTKVRFDYPVMLQAAFLRCR